MDLGSFRVESKRATPANRKTSTLKSGTLEYKKALLLHWGCPVFFSRDKSEVKSHKLFEPIVDGILGVTRREDGHEDGWGSFRDLLEKTIVFFTQISAN